MFIFSYFYCPNFNVKILEVSTHACSYQLNTLVQLTIIFLINPGSHHLIQIKRPKHQMMMVLVMPQGKVMVRKSMMGTSQITMMNRDKGMKTWSRKMTQEYIAMDCTMKMERILMTITMIMVMMNIESKSNCVRRGSSWNVLLNSLKPLQRNYKIRLEANIERKLKEKRNSVVEFIKERLELDVIRIPNLVEQFFKIQFAFKAFLFYFLLFSHSPGIQINVSGVVFSGCNFLFFINLDFGNNFCGKSIREFECLSALEILNDCEIKKKKISYEALYRG